jgi:peptidoglycan/LPS O-acetylase OafA/YrhL
MTNIRLPNHEVRKSGKEGYYPALDGLRGVAVILVILYHNFYIIPFLRFGWMGVDIFFVLSGFLITSTFLASRDKPRPLLWFYWKRILRIFPLYYLSLIIFILILPLFIHIPGSGYYTSNQLWWWIFLENWFYIFNHQSTLRQSYLIHFWSLALEEQYYLICPWILLFIKDRQSLIRFILAALCLTFAARFVIWRLADKDLSLFFFFNFTRIDGLCVGSLLAIATHFSIPDLGRRLIKITIITGSVCIILLMLKHFALPTLPFFAFGGYILISLITALIIHFLRGSANTLLLNNRWLVLTGRISFGIYVIHWPIYLIGSPYIEHLLLPSGKNPSLPHQIMISFICTAITWLLAYLSYYGYEIYFLKLKKRLPFSIEG